MNSTTDPSSLSKFPVLCRKAATASFRIYSSLKYDDLQHDSFGIYSKTVTHVPSLKDEDLQHDSQLETLNDQWLQIDEIQSSTLDIYEGRFFLVHVSLDNNVISITYKGTNHITDMVMSLVVNKLEVWDLAHPQIKVHNCLTRNLETIMLSKQYRN